MHGWIPDHKNFLPWTQDDTENLKSRLRIVENNLKAQVEQNAGLNADLKAQVERNADLKAQMKQLQEKYDSLLKRASREPLKEVGNVLNKVVN